jgi:hypothetical protein
VRARGVGHVHSFVFEDVVAEERDGGAVHGEASEGHGLLVRLPVDYGVDVIGDACEGTAVVFDFLVEVEEEDFRDLHWRPQRVEDESTNEFREEDTAENDTIILTLPGAVDMRE